MQLETHDVVLAVVAMVASMGIIAAVFFLVLIRHYNANVRRNVELLRAVLDTQENERDRIATDMHDGLGQVLSAIRMRVSCFQSYGREELHHNVQDVKVLIDDAVVEMRQVIRNLIPKGIAESGLSGAMDEMCRHISRSHRPIAVNFQCLGEPLVLDRRYETSIYRIVQELLNNAIKHACASEIFLTLEYNGDRLSVTVEDNGIGISKNYKHGNGLRNIKSRVDLIGGKFCIAPVRQGTIATVEIPFKHHKLVEAYELRNSGSR